METTVQRVAQLPAAPPSADAVLKQIELLRNAALDWSIVVTDLAVELAPITARIAEARTAQAQIRREIRQLETEYGACFDD